MACLVALVTWPWVSATLPWEDLPDAKNHLVRILVVDAALRQEWFPRWLPDLYLGYGYPLLNYYAPGLYYLGAALHRLGLSIYQSLQYAGLIGVAAGASGAFALARALFGRDSGALLAAAAYLLAPYPFFTNLYVRGDVPEVLALGLLPWLLCAAWKVWQGSRRSLAALAALTAALVLTHNVTALFGIALLACWVGALAVLPASPSPNSAMGGRVAATGRVALAVATGLALSAFFWLPALAEWGAVRMSLVQSDIFDFHRWLFDPLAAGGNVAAAAYPHTRTGPADLAVRFRYDALNLHVPEKISLPQVLLWVAGTAAALLPSRAAGSLTSPRYQRRLALVWSAFAAGLWFLNTTWSTWLWEHLPLLSSVQFPWRLYGPLALCVALVAAGGLATLPNPSPKSEVRSPRSVARQGPPPAQREPTPRRWWPGLPAQWRVPLAGYVFTLGIAAAMAANAAVALRPHRTAPPPVHDVDARTLIAEEYNRFAAGTTSGGEFLPQQVDWPKYSTGVWEGIYIYEQAFPEAGWQAGLVRLLDGRAAVTDLVRTPAAISAQVDGDTPSRLAFHQLLFAGWQAHIDGQAATLQAASYAWTAPDPPHEEVHGTLGFMVVDVPAGSHRVEVRFGPTPARTLGRTVSTAGFAFALAWCSWRLFVVTFPHRVRRPPAPQVARPALLLAVVALAGLAACSVSYVARPDGLLARNPVEAHRVALDISGAVRAGADSTTPAGAGHGLAPPFLDLSYLRVAGEERRWLYMHPPSSAVVPLRVPPHAYFQAGLALDPQTWDTPLGDGVRFILDADGPSGRVRLLDRHVNPRARGEERRWIDVWVSLEPLAGQSVRLTLRTESADDPSFDWAGWANPQIVLWPGLRPSPGIPHPF